MLSIILPLMVILYHFGGIIQLSMINDAWLDFWFIPPKAILTNKWHVRGAISAACGTVIILVSDAHGLLDYGIFLGGAFVLADPIFIFRALRDYHRDKRQR